MATDIATHGISHIGASLPVDNVQELASKNLKNIPHRYIQPDINPDDVSVDETSQIPVIDMSKLKSTSNSEYQTEMAKLHQACKEWGFFQIIGHGATRAIENMEADTQEFFKLPLEEKRRYAQVGLEGYGQAFVMSEDQKLDWCDMLAIYSMPVSTRNMRQWPANPTSFRSSLDEYSAELHKVCISLYKAMAINLGVEFEKIVDMFKEWIQVIRFNYYPPCSQADKVLGITPHSDGSALTLLVQINDVEGLQISKDGKWVPVKPVPGAIIVNIGDMFEIMSNGEYRSIEHRAVVNFQKERLSIAAFHNSSSKAIISPLSDINEAKYRTICNEDYLNQYMGSKLDGKSTIHSMRISN